MYSNYVDLTSNNNIFVCLHGVLSHVESVLYSLSPCMPSTSARASGMSGIYSVCSAGSSTPSHKEGSGTKELRESTALTATRKSFASLLRISPPGTHPAVCVCVFGLLVVGGRRRRCRDRLRFVARSGSGFRVRVHVHVHVFGRRWVDTRHEWSVCATCARRRAHFQARRRLSFRSRATPPASTICWQSNFATVCESLFISLFAWRRRRRSLPAGWGAG